MINNNFRSSKEKFFHSKTDQNFFKTKFRDEDDDPGESFEDYKIIKELGKGSQGIIFKVHSLKNNKIYVMKKINLKKMNPQQQKDSLKEAQILKRVKHPHIITYFKSFLHSECLYIIMEYARNGDLEKVPVHFTKVKIQIYPFFL